MPLDLPQVVRDLLWVVTSPSFCEGPQVAPPLALRAADIDQDDLAAFMAERVEHRVGRYFEHLVLYWLSRIRMVDMVGHGLQLRDGKRTVGEIDFLYRDEAGLLTHCEATVKFFLHYPRTGASDFPGPNAVDDYERKTNRLFAHQLVISHDHYPDIDQRHAFVKGIVFYRQDQPTAELPARMPANHLQGRWLRETELEQLGDRGATSGCIAQKPTWLAGPHPRQAIALDQLQDELRAHFRTGKRHPVMISMFAPGTIDDTEERLFVVPSVWPGTTTS